MLSSFDFGTRVRFARAVLLVATVVAVPGATINAREASHARAAAVASTSAFSPAAWDRSTVASIDPSVFERALGAASCAVRSGTVSNPATLTVIDYSKPSTSKRLWVFDLQSHELLYE
jgi:hypothetical protein